MRYYLARFKVVGIKNLDQRIQLDFCDKTIRSHLDWSQSNIKAIYGSNGSGKSAIMNAMAIYKELVMNSNYLYDHETTLFLNEIINKKTRKLQMEVTFLILNAQAQIQTILIHSVCLKQTGFKDFVIAEEQLKKHTGQTLDTGKTQTLYHVEEGSLKSSDFKEIESLKTMTANLMKKQTIPAILIQHTIENKAQIPLSTFIKNILSVYFFAEALHIELSTSDLPRGWIRQKQKQLSDWTLDDLREETSSASFEFNTEDDVIPIPAYPQYQRQIQRLAEFIQIFKMDLLGIENECKEVQGNLVITKYLVYKDFRIASEFESTGIKKLITLFNAFKSFMNGDLVFIDELDANLHDVYLCRLLDYFCAYGKGQLCFTTHNLGPMEVLSKRKHSIDFLSNNSEIISWKKKGNYSVINLYRNGMIDNSPFNIEPFDFLGLFEDEDQ